mgnify:CR=1 FL=1
MRVYLNYKGAIDIRKSGVYGTLSSPQLSQRDIPPREKKKLEEYSDINSSLTESFFRRLPGRLACHGFLSEILAAAE